MTQKYNLEELKFEKYFEDKGRIRVISKDAPRSYATFWKREFRLYDSYSLLHRDFYEFGDEVKKKTIGRIDLVFRFRGKLWVGESKYYTPHGSEFWDACKVLAYTAYYNWQNEESGGFDPARPAVLIPKKSVKLQHLITANKLKLLVLGIEKVENEYTLEEMATPL
jgi:hypothetical protein